ncbi:hypothetical protein PAPHI01_0686 [Pancytospora philotis]|nr:hypothetical protein PAPHI01_0686 [Pancytospora philotis]
MEAEIDEIFMDTAEAPTDMHKIAKLQQCGDAFPAMYPCLELLLDDVRELSAHFSLYSIRLRCLAHELDAIQKKNNELEAHGTRERAVYDALRGLCIALSVDERHFGALENGSFDEPGDLARMEQSLDVLGAVDLDRYTLRVVQERRDEIMDAQRNFLRRFNAHLEQLRIPSESRGELRVHRALYKTFERYRFIFSFARRHAEYYSRICGAYEMHSKQMYDHEFGSYLENVCELADSPPKLSCAIDMLVRSYESLMACELGCRRKMDADFSLDRIFKDTSAAIVEFVGDVFKQTPLVTLTAVGMALNAERSPVEEYERFRKELRKKYAVLEDLFVRAEAERMPTKDTVGWLNRVRATECQDTLKSRLTVLYVRKLVTLEDETPAEQYLGQLQLLYAVEGEDELVPRAIKKMESQLQQRVIKYVFAHGSERVNVERLLRMLDETSPGYAELAGRIRSVVLGNADHAMLPQLQQIFEAGVQG